MTILLVISVQGSPVYTQDVEYCTIYLTVRN